MDGHGVTDELHRFLDRIFVVPLHVVDEGVLKSKRKKISPDAALRGSFTFDQGYAFKTLCA